MEGRDASNLMSMPVISTSEGKELGKVKDVLFDPNEHAILAVMVTPSGRDTTMLVVRERINSIGDKAITVNDVGALQELTAAPRAQEIIDSCVHLRGTSVVSETGNSLGTVDKILIDESGNVAAYRASSGLLGFGAKTDISPSEVISVGQDALVVSASAEQKADDGEPSSSAADTIDTSTANSARADAPIGGSSSGAVSSDEVMRTNNDPGTTSV